MLGGKLDLPERPPRALIQPPASETARPTPAKRGAHVRGAGHLDHAPAAPRVSALAFRATRWRRTVE